MQMAVQPHVECTNLWLCSPDWVAAPGDAGPGQSRCEQIHTNGSDGHDLVSVAG